MIQWIMAHYITPHTQEWFEHLARFNPQQAAHTKQILVLAGNDQVCSVCGDESDSDYYLDAKGTPSDAVLTLRLCDDCRGIRTGVDGYPYLAFPDKSGQ